MKKLSGVKYWVNSLDAVAQALEEVELLKEMGASDGEIEVENGKIEDMLGELELKSMLGEEGDNLGALLKINSGAGGTESNDWSSMLLRMYTRWGERNGYKVTVYADDISASRCVTDWLYGINTTGTLYSLGSADFTGKVPSNWTISTTPPA